MSSALMTVMRPQPAQSNVETVQKEELVKEQSVEVMQLMVLTVINIIMFLRGICPDAYYKAKVFDPQDATLTYEDLKNGDIPVHDAHKLRRLVKCMILARGRSDQTDKLLDWIDGLLVPLKKQYLASAQVTFFRGTVSPDNVIESYMMEFSYNSGVPNMNLQHGNTPQGVPVTIGRDSVSDVLRELAKFLPELPRLPDKKLLSIQLRYNINCPVGYNAPGFVTCHNPQLLQDENTGISYGSVDTPHLKADLRHVTGPRGTPITYSVHPKPPPGTQLPEGIVDGTQDAARWRNYGNIPIGQNWDSLVDYLKWCHNAHYHIYTRYGKDVAAEVRDTGRIPAVAWKRKNTVEFEYVHPSEVNNNTNHTSSVAPARTTRANQQNNNPVNDASALIRSKPSFSGPMTLKGHNERSQDREPIARTGSMMSDVTGARQSQENTHVTDVRGMATSRNQDTLDTQAFESTRHSQGIDEAANSHSKGKSIEDGSSSLEKGSSQRNQKNYRPRKQTFGPDMATTSNEGTADERVGDNSTWQQGIERRTTEVESNCIPLERPSPLMEIPLSQKVWHVAVHGYDRAHKDLAVKGRMTCPCGSSVENGHDAPSMDCDSCKAYQHCHCYGYVDQNEVPEKFLCYPCLLQNELSRLEFMTTFCKIRNVVHKIYRKDYTNDGELGFKFRLSLGHTDFLDINNCLMNHGFLTVRETVEPEPGIQQYFQYNVVRTPEQLTKLFRLFYDPQRGVADYFEMPGIGSVAGDKLSDRILDVPPRQTNPTRVDYAAEGFRSENPALHRTPAEFAETDAFMNIWTERNEFEDRVNQKKAEHRAWTRKQEQEKASGSTAKLHISEDGSARMTGDYGYTGQNNGQSYGQSIGGNSYGQRYSISSMNDSQSYGGNGYGQSHGASTSSGMPYGQSYGGNTYGQSYGSSAMNSMPGSRIHPREVSEMSMLHPSNAGMARRHMNQRVVEEASMMVPSNGGMSGGNNSSQHRMVTPTGYGGDRMSDISSTQGTPSMYNVSPYGNGGGQMGAASSTQGTPSMYHVSPYGNGRGNGGVQMGAVSSTRGTPSFAGASPRGMVGNVSSTQGTPSSSYFAAAPSDFMEPTENDVCPVPDPNWNEFYNANEAHIRGLMARENPARLVEYDVWQAQQNAGPNEVVPETPTMSGRAKRHSSPDAQASFDRPHSQKRLRTLLNEVDTPIHNTTAAGEDREYWDPYGTGSGEYVAEPNIPDSLMQTSGEGTSDPWLQEMIDRIEANPGPYIEDEARELAYELELQQRQSIYPELPDDPDLDRYVN